MKIVNRSTVVGSIVCVAIIIAFSVIRSETLDRSYRGYLESRTISASSLFRDFFRKNEFSKESISFYLKETTTRYSDLSLIAVTGADQRIVLMSRNNKTLSDPETYDLIADDLYGGRYTAGNPVHLDERYYKSKKYYILNSVGEKGSVIMVYPRQLPFRLILRFILELIAVASVSIAVYGLAYSLYMKNRSEKESTGKKSTAEKKKSAPKQRVYVDIFADLAQEFQDLTATLILLDKKSAHPHQQISYTEGTTSRTDKVKARQIETRKEIMDELRKGAPILRDKSKRVLYPVLSGGSLVAILTVTLQRRIAGKDLATIKHHASVIYKTAIKL